LSGEAEVGLFVGDEAHYLWPQLLPALDTLLGTLELNPIMIGTGRSNGLIAQSAGFEDVARHIVKATLHEVESAGAQTLLLLSAGDYFAFGQMMTERLQMSRPARVQMLELTTLLAQKLAAGEISFTPTADDRPYAYVDPTHAVRVPERHDRVRSLVTAVMPRSPLELLFRKERAHPVGSTYLQFSNAPLAEQLTHARLQDAQNSGAQLLICEDPATLYQLKQFAGDYGMEVQGLYELLAAGVW
jgi:Fe-S oxidoreductase